MQNALSNGNANTAPFTTVLYPNDSATCFSSRKEKNLASLNIEPVSFRAALLLLSAHNEPEPSVPTTTRPPFLHTLTISDIAFSYSFMNSSAVMDMTRSKLSSGKSRDTASPTETLVNPLDLAISSIFSDTSIPVISFVYFLISTAKTPVPIPMSRTLSPGFGAASSRTSSFS